MRRTIGVFICGLLIATNVWATSNTTYGPTIAADSIWHIAEQLRPNSEITVPQVILSIFYSNKNAFYKNNINALGVGKTLNIPDVQVMQSIPVEEAFEEVATHNRKWNKSLRKIKASKAKAYAKRKRETSIVKQVPALATEGVTTAKGPDQTNSSGLPAVNSQVATPVSTAGSLPNGQVLTTLPVALGTVPVLNVPPAADTVALKELTNRVEDAENKNSVIQTQVNQITERIDSLEKNIHELKEFEQKMKGCFSSKFFGSIRQIENRMTKVLGPQLFKGIIIALILILVGLLVYLLIPKRKVIPLSYQAEHGVDDKEEYDLMEGKEGSAAKLNLARAYMEMGEKEKALGLLSKIMLYGTDAEQEEAKSLIEKIKNTNEKN